MCLDTEGGLGISFMVCSLFSDDFSVTNTT
jgi:hypothetical protein